MLLNLIITFLILVVCGYVVFRYVKSLDDTTEIDEVEQTDAEIDINYLVKEVAREFARMLRKSVNDDRMSRDELERKRKRIATIRKNLNEAAYGDTNAKISVKNQIADFLTSKRIGISEENINTIIPFDRPANMSPTERFETVLYVYNKKYESEGFSYLVKQWDLDDYQTMPDGDEYQIITKAQISMIYDCLFEKNKAKREELGLIESEVFGIVELSFLDKLEILSQRVYELYAGLGAIDMLRDSEIDEIDGGVSGIPKGSFKVKGLKGYISYSNESVWVTYHGANIHLECISFETQEELERVCDNIYKYNAPHVMSRKKGYVVSTMIDGSRIVVCRPPFADSYAFFLRKFDSAPSVKPWILIRDKNNIIPILMMKYMILGHRNVAITGSQGTGKTTLLKSIIGFIPTRYSLRIQELAAELNLRFTYPLRNILAFQETDFISAQEGLNLQKKTNGAVNIIGEVASAIQACHIIQTAFVASLFALFTHHAKTARGLVEAISNNLLEMGLYKDKKDAVAMAAQVLNVDCHVENNRGKRYIERITEIIPAGNIPYPSDEWREQNACDRDTMRGFINAYGKAADMKKEDEEFALALGMEKDDYCLMRSEAEMKALMDTPEYFKRVTNPELYSTKDLVVWEPLYDENGEPVYDPERKEVVGIFKLVSRPSEIMMQEMCKKMSDKEEKQFLHDLDMMEKLSNGEESEEITEWMKTALQTS